MSADTSDLSKVDSAVSGLSSSPTESKIGQKKERKSSSYPGVFNINDLKEEGTKIELAPETQTTGWKLNKSSTAVEDPAILKLMLTKPPIKKIDLQFPMGLEVTARNLKGVTIKDALDAIHKQFKKKADDELDKPYLAGFEWDPETAWDKLIVHQATQPTTFASGGGKKSKKAKKNAEDEE